MKPSIHEKHYKYCPTCKTRLKRLPVDNRKLLSCTNCGFVFWNNPKPVVSVVLLNQGKILMLQRANKPLKNYWCLPGGYINYEERPEEAIIREAKEEIGASIEIKRLIGVYRIDNDPRGVNIDIIYETEVDGKIILSNEHRNYGFHDPEKLPAKIAYKHREAISDWKKIRRTSE